MFFVHKNSIEGLVFSNRELKTLLYSTYIQSQMGVVKDFEIYETFDTIRCKVKGKDPENVQEKIVDSSDLVPITYKDLFVLHVMLSKPLEDRMRMNNEIKLFENEQEYTILDYFQRHNELEEGVKERLKAFNFTQQTVIAALAGNVFLSWKPEYNHALFFDQECPLVNNNWCLSNKECQDTLNRTDMSVRYIINDNVYRQIDIECFCFLFDFMYRTFLTNRMSNDNNFI